jgi:hypothetical protein
MRIKSMPKIADNLLPTRIDRTEQVISRYFHVAAAGTTLEHVLDTGYWPHVARRLRLHDEIRVAAADGSFDVELTVSAVDPRGLWAQTVLLRERKSASGAAAPAAAIWPDADGYRVEFSGPHKWRILDRNNSVVEKGLDDEPAAIAALAAIKAKKAA